MLSSSTCSSPSSSPPLTLSLLPPSLLPPSSVSFLLTQRHRCTRQRLRRNVVGEEGTGLGGELLISFPLTQRHRCTRQRLRRNVVGEEGAGLGGELLRKPRVTETVEEEEEREGGEREGEGWVDWEDQILEVTVPLVGFVRMILHSGKYESGDRLSPEHEKTILERLLPHHPEWEKKIGVGVDYITVGYHPNFETSRCLFIVRKDGELVDFSYWKCIKGLIKKNYPLYADSFILRHFRRRSRND